MGVLLRHPIEVVWGNRFVDPAISHIREKVPWREETAAIVLEEEGLELFRIERSRQRPVVDLAIDVDALANAKGDDRVKVEWRAEGPKPLFAYLSFSNTNGATWSPLGTRRDGSTAEIQAGGLPGGENCRLRVRVTDGVNTR